jgi:uncharacterized protein (TIGR02569 family)
MSPLFVVDGLVFKRAEGVDEVNWRSELLSDLPETGFRVARPVMAESGEWVVDGWTASRFVDGHHDPARIPELLRASRAFHSALADVPRPGFLDRLSHRWARAHRVALEGATLDMGGPCAARFADLEDMRRATVLPSQLVHGDLAGNVLVADDDVPALLDFSPWWAPVAYAEGILMVDALLWTGATPKVLALVSDQPEFAQMFLRAAMFRLVALNEASKEGHPEYLAEIEPFDELISILRSLMGG